MYHNCATVHIFWYELIGWLSWGNCQYNDWVTGWITGVRFSAGTMKEFFLHHHVQTGFGAHSASCPADTMGLFP
jgi:hypothetical protein